MMVPAASMKAWTGFIRVTNDELSREAYAELWEYAADSENIVSDAEWLVIFDANDGNVPHFSYGDGIHTFRTPTQPPYVRGGSEIGYLGDAIRNIESTFGGTYTSDTKPPFEVRETIGVTNSGGYFTLSNVNFDLSTIVPTADENRPKTFVYPYYIKAVGTAVNPDGINLTRLAELVNYLATSFGEYIWYPGGGDVDSPGNVTSNQSYELANPFPGCPVHCVADLYYEDMEGDAGWYTDLYSNANRAFGLKASHRVDSDVIVLQTGVSGLVTNGNTSGGIFGYQSTALASAPVRVRIYKLYTPTKPMPELNIGISEAPNDGNDYVRKGKKWVQATQVASGIPDAPDDGRPYLRINGEWAEAPNDLSPVGAIGYSLSERAFSGYLHMQGQEPLREAFPALWQWAKDSGLVITEDEWQALRGVQSSVGFFSDGDGLTSFRLPHIVDIFRPVALGGERGGGEYQGDALQGHWHEVMAKSSSSSSTGALGGTGGESGPFSDQVKNPVTDGVNGEPRVADETRMRNIAVYAYIKAYDTISNGENYDLVKLQQQIDTLQARFSDMLDSVGCTYVYPNGGEEGNEAAITAGQRYLMSNPYPGRVVDCIAELFLGGVWTPVAWGTTGDVSSGVLAYYTEETDVITVVAGYNTLSNGSLAGNWNGTVVPVLESVASAPCRVRVWKVGGTTARYIDQFVKRETIVYYPNGGSAGNPATIGVNTRWVEEIPDGCKGYHIGVMTEIKYGVYDWTPASVYYNGSYILVKGGVYQDRLVVQSGRSAVCVGGSYDGLLNGDESGASKSSCQVRLIITKLGRKG